MTVGKNVGKTKCWLFDNHSSLDEVPLQLPKLSINNQKKKKKKKKRWKKSILCKISWGSFRWKHVTEGTFKDSLLSLYFSYIHSCIKHFNLEWASAQKKIPSQQKHVVRIVYNNDRYYHMKQLFRSCNMINVCKLNLLNTLIPNMFLKRKSWQTKN